jgi:hypothetical protein
LSFNQEFKALKLQLKSIFQSAVKNTNKNLPHGLLNYDELCKKSILFEAVQGGGCEAPLPKFHQHGQRDRQDRTGVRKACDKRH